MRIGIDTGGTFTDFVVVGEKGIKVFKLPSTPEQPERAILSGLKKIDLKADDYLIQHGSTVGTNALLERKGAKTALITNEGFEDIVEIGRQNRNELYSLTGSRPEMLVPRRMRIGMRERLLWDGTPLIPLEDKSLDWLKMKIRRLKPEAVAVTLLYSYLSSESEKRIREALGEFGVPVSLSSEILPEFREYERTSTTVVNAYLSPTMSAYLSSLGKAPAVQKGRLTMMQSNGGSVSPDAAAREPVRTLFSGPAGGVVGAFEIARAAGIDKIITFDMGGTSTDVSLCDGEIQTTGESKIGGYPVSVQMIAIHSVGAGGGSIVWVDDGGLIKVGPQSAGADPGPVAYGKGSELTVADCNIQLGRMDPDYFLAGEMRLFPERIPEAIDRIRKKLGTNGQDWSRDELAEGILQICNTQMENALRVISLQKGYDTRDFTLVTYGGAGGLHACHLARALMIPRVLVPQHPGALSALGILRADVVKDAARTVLLDGSDRNIHKRLAELWSPLEASVKEKMTRQGFAAGQVRLERALDVRYLGQSHEIRTPYSEQFRRDFNALHERLYGYSNRNVPIEVVNLRVRGAAAHPKIELERHKPEGERPADQSLLQEKRVTFDGNRVATAFRLRSRLRAGNRVKGPAVILEYSGTTLIPPGFEARIDPFMNLVIQVPNG